MRTIYRYVLWEMLPSFLVCVALLTFLFMINKVFLSLDLVLNKKVSLSETLLLYVGLLPFILSITVPMAMMVGTLLAFGRLSSDMEVTAFKSGGGHLFHLIAPILVLGFFMTGLMLVFNDTLLPASQFMVKKIQFNMVRNKADVAIRERVFIDQFEGHQFLIDREDRNGVFSDVKVFDHWSPNASVQTTLAKTGTLETDQKNYQVFFHLNDGIMSWDNNNYHTYNQLYFQHYIIRLNLESQLAGLSDVKKDFEDLDLHEIALAIPKETDPGRLNYMKTEYQKRLALPFACLILAWFCAPLGLWTRSKGFMGFILGLSMIFVYYLMFIFGQTLSNEGKINPFLGLWGANIIWCLGGFLIYYLVISERSAFKPIGHLIGALRPGRHRKKPRTKP
ncbi:MAG TPA: LptF/LptG family permease [bacterium]|nr:LptF/LptG family permease [bacterium]